MQLGLGYGTGYGIARALNLDAIIAAAIPQSTESPSKISGNPRLLAVPSGRSTPLRVPNGNQSIPQATRAQAGNGPDESV